MGIWTDPDPAFTNTAAAKAGQAGKAEGVETRVKATSSALDQATSGRGPDAFGATSSDVRGALRTVATDAAVIPTIAAAAKKAIDDFNSKHPNAAELNAAELKVRDAKDAKEKALAAPGAETPGTDADKAAWDACKAYETACTELRDLKAQRKVNRDRLFEDLRRAIALAKKISTETDGETGGYGTPGGKQETPGGGYGKPGTTGAGTPAPAPKSNPGSTPGATPKAETPKTEAPGSGKSSTPDAASLAAAQALLNGQGQQQPQAQTGTPAATQPQQAQQPQAQQEKKDEKKDGKQALDEDDIRRLVNGEDPEKVLGGAPLGISSVVNATGPGAPQAASSGQNGTSFRPAGTPIPGTTTGGAPATPQPSPTTGHSVTGLNTQTDVSGKSTPPPTAYDQTKTNTSGAHGNTTTAQQQAATQQAGKGAMPMMPMTPMGAMGAPAGGGGATPRKSEDLPHTSSGGPSDGSRLDHGQTAVSEAVPGGTICQNKPDTGKAA